MTTQDPTPDVTAEDIRLAWDELESRRLPFIVSPWMLEHFTLEEIDVEARRMGFDYAVLSADIRRLKTMTDPTSA